MMVIDVFMYRSKRWVIVAVVVTLVVVVVARYKIQLHKNLV